MTPSSRAQSELEERANCISHGIGFVLAALALPVLVTSCTRSADPGAACWQQVAGVCVFAVTMMLLYLSSTLFHGAPEGRRKQLLERMDRASIYLFIAGSYTPIAAASLHGPGSWLMLILVWAMAAAGVLLTHRQKVEHPLWSTALYVAMGWLVLLAAIPWISRMSPLVLSLLVVGGLVYTVGALLFLLGGRIPFAHLGWHVAVMAGSGLHFSAVLLNV